MGASSCSVEEFRIAQLRLSCSFLPESGGVFRETLMAVFPGLVLGHVVLAESLLAVLALLVVLFPAAFSAASHFETLRFR